MSHEQGGIPGTRTVSPVAVRGGTIPGRFFRWKAAVGVGLYEVERFGVAGAIATAP
jgi:hypothetical protein